MSGKKFLDKNFNVAAVRVSTNSQDCDRQKEILANLAYNLGIKYDVWLEDKGQKRGCIERDSFKKLEEISFLHPLGFNLWYSDVTRLGTYELWEKQKNEFFIPHKISIFTPNMLWDICFPETITERVMTTCLFAVATNELESLSKRIKGKHESMMKAGLYTTANVPWVCDVRREDLFGDHIFTWREVMSRMKAKKLGEKVRHIIIMPSGEIRNENPPKHDKEKDVQWLCLTGDKDRIDIIWYIFNWCKKQRKLGIGYTWNQLANDLSNKFEDTYGCGWTSDRCRDLIINPSCIGLPVLGKTTRPNSPTMFFRNKNEEDGFERNNNFRLGKCKYDAVPESNWVQPEKPLFDLLPRNEWIELKNHIVSLEYGQIENIKNIEKVNEVRKNKGLNKLCRHEKREFKNWLNDFIWDDVHDCKFISGGKQVVCIIRAENMRYKKNKSGACPSFAVKMLNCILHDYFRLPDFKNYDISNYKTDVIVKMQKLINKFTKVSERHGKRFEDLYLLSWDRSNFDIIKEIKEINDQLSNMYRFIGSENMPTLKQKAIKLENRKIFLESNKEDNLVYRYQLEQESMNSLKESLEKVQKGIASDEDIQLVMNKMRIKIHVNCKDEEKYVRVISDKINTILEISESDYHKFYRSRFYHWAKDKEFDYLSGKYYDGSTKTKKKNKCPSMIKRHKWRKKRNSSGIKVNQNPRGN